MLYFVPLSDDFIFRNADQLVRDLVPYQVGMSSYPLIELIDEVHDSTSKSEDEEA